MKKYKRINLNNYKQNRNYKKKNLMFKTYTEKCFFFLLTDTFTVVQAINAMGFGKFQVKLSLFTGLCWMVDSMEITILSILSPSLHCDWGISRYQQALTTTVLFEFGSLFC